MRIEIWVKGIRSDENGNCYNIIVFFCIFATIALVTQTESIFSLYGQVYSGIIIGECAFYFFERKFRRRNQG